MTCESRTILDRLSAYPADLIPLNGHIPRKGWPTADYSDFDSDLWTGNLGFRLRPETLVIDCDVRHMLPGDDPLQRLCEDIGEHLRDALGTFSGGGGLHLYFSKPGGPVRKLLEAYPGLEFYTAVHYMIAPGSTHRNTGKLYRFKDGEVRPAPAALLALLDRPEACRSGEAGVLDEGELTALLAALDAREFGAGRYPAWIALAAACHDATGGYALSEWLEWCATDDDYAHEDAQALAESTWNGFKAGRPGGASYKTLFFLVRKAGRADLVEPIEARIKADEARKFWDSL